ncbi:MAG: type II toxin-antitoxin system HicB family antitoxin [Acidobacteria bacterium]|nr:type II toxin-antitoxin system HicB family antitoxin [Acidobacteriota bacterium]
MSPLVQIRNVPPDLHRRLKARAAMAGMSMSEYALRELRKSLERATREEILERLASRPARRLRRPAADVIRAERDSR